jgi:hypothetical protein
MPYLPRTGEANPLVFFFITWLTVDDFISGLGKGNYIMVFWDKIDIYKKHLIYLKEKCICVVIR